MAGICLTLGGIIMIQDFQESPEWVQTSLAGAMCLGLERGRVFRNAESTCLNILLTYKNGCKAACSYCGLGRSRENITDRTFIRVKWPAYTMLQILHQLKMHPHPFKRICISMITNQASMRDSVIIIKDFKENTDLPISTLVSPTVMKGREDLKKLHNAGADHIGIAIDTATEELFERHRGKNVNGPHKWKTYWDLVEEAVDVFGPKRAGVHFVVGLGETEREMVSSIDRAHQIGAVSHMFSFYPEPGSQLQDHPQSPMEQYRRIQLARYLINEGR
jgi:biotin synthase-related radical SAM superfamily protein